MILSITSAILGILAIGWQSKFWPLGFVFLVPFFIFLLREKNIFKILIGSFLFRFVLAFGLFYFAFEPIIWSLSILIFLGFPLLFFILRKYLGEKNVFSSLPFLFIIFDFLEAKYTFLPTYAMTSGVSLASSPFLGLAGFGGLITLSLFVVLINWLVCVLIVNIKKISPGNFWKLNLQWPFSLILIFSIFGLLLSQYRLQRNKAVCRKLPSLNIAVVSTNRHFDQEFKQFEDLLPFNQREKVKQLITKKIELIKNNILNRHSKIDIVFLPEDMIDVESWDNPDQKAFSKFNITNDGILIEPLRQLAKDLNSYLAVTVTSIDQNKQRYNTTIIFNRNGELLDFKNKTYLTIGGEYYPFKWVPFYYKIEEKNLLQSGNLLAIFDKKYQYQKGEIKILKAGKFKFGSAICLEIHKPSYLKKIKNLGSAFIYNPSNDSWISFGENSYSKLTNSLRKIESVWLNLPIISSPRNGKAGIILPSGQIKSTGFDKSSKKNYQILFKKINLDIKAN